MNVSMAEELLTSDEIIVELKISHAVLERLLASGQIQAVRSGVDESPRFKRGDVESALHSRGPIPDRAPVTRAQMPMRGMMKRG